VALTGSRFEGRRVGLKYDQVSAAHANRKVDESPA
jgi:hypothetical protein